MAVTPPMNELENEEPVVDSEAAEQEQDVTEAGPLGAAAQ